MKGLFDYTLETLAARPGAVAETVYPRLYTSKPRPKFTEAQAIQTNFEGKYRAVGVPIKYVQFRLS